MTTPGFEYFNSGIRVRYITCGRTVFSSAAGRANHHRLMKIHQGPTQPMLEAL